MERVDYKSKFDVCVLYELREKNLLHWISIWFRIELNRAIFEANDRRGSKLGHLRQGDIEANKVMYLVELKGLHPLN